MSHQIPIIRNTKVKEFNLETRTAKFGENIIRFCKQIKRSPVNNPLITQFIKSGTSVGANYCEADDAESKADFIHKIGICKKEARESKHWLRMIVISEPGLKTEARILWQEAKELNLIFNAIIRKTKENLK
jgi:four helix bundle protein